MMTIDHMLDLLIQREGGYVNDPDDPGGETKYGIAKRYHPEVDIPNLTVEGAKAIYAQKYFIDPKIYLLPPSLREQVFDTGVNQGTQEAIKLLQGVLGLTKDGIIGPLTLAALAAHPDLRAVNNSYVAARVLSYVNRAVRTPKKLKYLKGWVTRALGFLL